MLGALIKDDTNGVPVLEIWETPTHMRTISMQALAVRAELWGIEDPVEVVEAIIAEQDRAVEPGELNPYGDVYKLLAHREQVRETAAAQALARRADKLAPSDPRSVELTAALAAYEAVHVPLAAGGECVMDRCRRRIRDAKGLTVEPTSKPGALSRVKATTVRPQLFPETVPVGPMTVDQDRQDRRAKLAALLEQVAWMVDNDRRSFLHELTGNTENPLEDVPGPAEAVPEESVEDVLDKYRREATP